MNNWEEPVADRPQDKEQKGPSRELTTDRSGPSRRRGRQADGLGRQRLGAEILHGANLFHKKGY
jgi:hypothetical protein